jgi:lysophospholipase L1-like esterase
MKTFLQRAALAFFGLLLGLLLAEGGLRAYGAYLRYSRAGGAATEAGASILCVGDSFTYGVGAPEGESYPAHLQKLLDADHGPQTYSVVNEGVPGQNSSELSARLDYLLAAYKPGVVLILTGANNYSLRNTNFFLFAPEELSAPARAALGADSLFSHLKVYRLIKFSWRGMKERLRETTYSPPPCSARSQAALSGAQAEFDRKDFTKASAMLEAALAEDAACAELSFQAGRMNFYYRDFPSAFRHFRQGKDLDPRHPFVKIFLSQEIPLLRPQAAGAALDKLLAYDLSFICEAALRAGAVPVIQTYPFGTDGQRDAVRKETAARFGAPVVDHREVFLPLTAGPKFRDYLSGDEPDLMASHPNSAGYALMARNALEGLAAAGLLPRPAGGNGK